MQIMKSLFYKLFSTATASDRVMLYLQQMTQQVQSASNNCHACCLCVDLAHMTSKSLRLPAVVAAVHVQGHSPAVHRHTKALTMITSGLSGSAMQCQFLAYRNSNCKYVLQLQCAAD